MKKTFHFFGIMILCMGMLQTAAAHAIWIESDAKAVRNKAHDVKVFYGEYPEGNPDSTQNWFSDLKNLEVWVTSPSKKRIKLVLNNAATYLSGSFIPEEDGVFYITTSHQTKELGGTTRYEFSSIVPVLSGKADVSSAVPDNLLAIIVQPKIYKANKVIELLVIKNGGAFAGKEVTIMSPDGWVKTVKTNDRGEVSFTPKSKGSYVIETSDYKKQEGEWNEKKYSHTWHGSTTRIQIN
jgi:uncharacterized GH25 family protein